MHEASTRSRAHSGDATADIDDRADRLVTENPARLDGRYVTIQDVQVVPQIVTVSTWMIASRGSVRLSAA
jgi:hypothetical protein